MDTPPVQQLDTARPGKRAGTSASGFGFAFQAVAAAWVLSLGFDMLLHAGALARLYTEQGPFLLPAEDAFRRIPLGYLSFLISTGALYWLLRRLDVTGVGEGFRYGAAAGSVVWGAFALGLYSVSTIPLLLAAGWWLGQSAELGLAGSVIGAAAGGAPFGKIWMRVAGAVVAFIAITIILQTVGLAPPMKMTD